MDLATLELDPEEAKARLDEYTTGLRGERTAEDRLLAMAYRAAARGLPIISLSQSVRAGGYFEDSCLPRIAIARADAKTCTVERGWAGREVTYTDEYASGRPVTAAVGANHVIVRDLELPEGRHQWRGTTVVPPVPPRHRPTRRNAQLRSHHILWEVEKWDPTPPRDPALLTHLRGDLWIVLAVWDLTDLERLVLGQRAPVTR